MSSVFTASLPMLPVAQPQKTSTPANWQPPSQMGPLQGGSPGVVTETKATGALPMPAPSPIEDVSQEGQILAAALNGQGDPAGTQQSTVKEPPPPPPAPAEVAAAGYLAAQETTKGADAAVLMMSA